MGTFTHPNILAFYLVLAFTFYFYILISGHLNSKRPLTVAIKAMMVNILVLLVATKTRNAWISVYVIFLIYGFLRDKRVLFILVGVVPLLLAIPDVGARMSNIWASTAVNNYHGVNSFEWRMQLWKVSLSKVLERPFQGYGLSSFQPSTEVFFPTAKDMHAHNSYIEILFETGLFGLLSFMALFFSPLFIFLRNIHSAVHQTQARVWAIMVAYLVSYMLICSADNLSFYLTFNWYVWFFIGLMLVASYRDYRICIK
jgi:O-antigen ligase